MATTTFRIASTWALITMLTFYCRAQDAPRRGTMGDRAYMAQMESARSVVGILVDGRSAGLCSFFKERDYCNAVQPVLDSLAGTWKQVTDEQWSVGGEIDGPENRMRITVLSKDRKPIGQLVLQYAPADAACQILRFEVIPKTDIVFTEDDLPPESPPPTFQELQENKK